MRHNNGRSTASLHPPYSYHNSHGSAFYQATYAAVVPAPDAS